MEVLIVNLMRGRCLGLQLRYPRVSLLPLDLIDYSLCDTVGKDFVYHACGHEFESRLQ